MRHLILALLATAAVPASAQIHRYQGLVLAPDGREMAAFESAGARSRLTVRAANGRVVRTLDPCATCVYLGLTYAPVGHRMAFLARDRAKGSVAVMVADGATVRTVATVAGLASTPRLSPDGKRIALLVTLGATKETGATQAGARQIGEIGEHHDDQRLAIIQVDGAADQPVTPLSPAGRFIYEYDWTPDGTGLVVTSALGNGDANWWVATLDRVDAGTGAVTSIARPTTQLNMPRVSPDGGTVAYVGGLMSDFGSIGGDVWTVPIGGGTPTNVTAGAKMTFTSLHWTAGGLRAAVLDNNRMGGVAIEPGGATRRLFAMPVSLAAGDGKIAWDVAGRTVASIVQDWTHAPAIYAGPAARPRQVTRDNDTVQPVVDARSVTWTNDGYTVQGWLLSPRGADRRTKAPMIVNVHGGPAAASTPRFIEKGQGSALTDAAAPATA